MTTTTARHELPLLVPGQAQKEMFHNEALAAIDMLLHAAVESVGLDAPPVAPEHGRTWVVGAAPSGDWIGRAHHLASWTSGGWRFAPPVRGMSVAVGAAGLRAAWDGTRWAIGVVEAERFVVAGTQVVGAQNPAITDPVGGSAIDAEARAALSAILTTLRTHGLIA